MGHPDVIAGYRVENVLGYGAHSTIFTAVDPASGQRYAVKRVVRNNNDEQRFIDQTINEFDIAQRIDHPNVRKCFSIKRIRKLMKVSEVIVVMEIVEGESLSQHKPETLLELVDVFIHVALGMGAMHQRGYIHADMKPNNVIVSEDGTVKVIDLGQSCPVGTVKQRIQGTPDYIAPEQVNLGKLDATTDIFNLGATMYWCLTGQHIPTLIPKVENTLQRVDKLDVKPPMEINKEIPIALNNLLVQCLKTESYERPQTMSELAARLRISKTQIEKDWTKEDLIEQFTAAYETRDMERAAHLLRLLDQNLTPEEAQPYMDMARDVLGNYKEVMGKKFKDAIAEQRWIDALNLGEQIMRHFPNSAFADEVKRLMRKLQRKASATEEQARGTAV